MRSRFTLIITFYISIVCFVFLSCENGLNDLSGFEGDVAAVSRSVGSPEGTFAIHLVQDGVLMEVGSIGCDRHVSLHEIDLSLWISNNEEVEIRIQKEDGGAAHLDLLTLGGTAPLEVTGNRYDDSATCASVLTHFDSGVIDAAGTQRFTFSADRDGNLLQLAGRIEPEVITKYPFLFPVSNTYLSVTEESDFYTYRVGTEPGTEIFSEYCVTGTGHPNAFTRCEVWDDNDTLYAVLEFGVDNTRDGEEDYTSVFISTDGGVKEFRITEGNSTWGAVEFKATRDIPYRHKIYHFVIPFAEAAINPESTTLDLAFAAYGTGAPPAPAADSTRNRFLVVQRQDGTFDIYGYFVDTAGNQIGSRFQIDQTTSADTPDIAFSSAGSSYLVVWKKNASPNQIAARVVNSDGTFGTDEFDLSPGSGLQTSVDIAYDSENDRYLVVWQDNRNTNYLIYGRLIESDGTPAGADFPVSSGSQHCGDPSVAFDPVSKRFLVAWRDNRNAAGAGGNDIYGQLVAQNGSAYGSEIIVCGDNDDQFYPEIAYDSELARFLVLWRDDRNLTYDIYGTLITSMGSRIGSIFEIVQGDTQHQEDTKVAYGKWLDEYLVVWTEESDPPGYDIFGLYLNADGSVKASPFQISSSGVDDYRYTPAPAYLDDSFTYLVAYEDDSQSPDIAFSALTRQSPYAAPQLVYPEDGTYDIRTDTTLIFKDITPPTGETVEYEVYISTNLEFSEVVPIEVVSLAGLGFAGFLTLILFRRRVAGRRGWVFHLLLVVFILISLVSGILGCSVAGEAPPAAGAGELSVSMDNLQPGTTYYWKVKAVYSGGYSIDSSIWSFTTAE